MGTGTILFSVWSMVKMLSLAIIYKAETISTIKNYASDTKMLLPDNVVYIMFIVMLLIALALFLSIRFYVGVAAISEGKGIRRRSVYLAAAVLILILEGAGVVNNIRGGLGEYEQTFYNDATFSGLIIGFTSIIMLLELILAAIRLRKYSESWGYTGPRHIKKKHKGK